MERVEQLQRELERARDRLHALEGNERAHHELLRLVRGRQRELERRVADVEATMQTITTEEKIADAVAVRLSESASLSFTRLQTWGIRVAIVGAGVSGVFAIGRTIARLVSG